MTKLRELRQGRSWTLRELADLTGCSLASLSRAERGLQNLSPEAKVEVARALSVPVAAVFPPRVDLEQVPA